MPQSPLFRMGLVPASIALLSCLAFACDATVEQDPVVDSDGSEDSDGADDDSEYRWTTVLPDFPTLVTSMNAATYGGDNGGCWDTSPSGSVRPFQQYQCHGKDNQLWLFRPASGGGFTIHSKDDDDLCLDVPSSNYVTGQGLQLYPCHGGSNQVFRTFGFDSQSATIRPRSATHMCLDVRGAVKTNQAAIQLYPCHGGANQAWRFHDYRGEDKGIDCDWNLRFGPLVMSPGSRRSFHATGHHFNTLCSENLESDSVNCPSYTDWFVVDSPWGSDDFDVRCFDTQ
ncbi:MAG: RICIN domain-containing protein [Myxococcota bacterium]